MRPQNWRGRPLTSRTAIVELIAATTTKTGLTVRCELDENTYAKGVKVSDAEMAALNISGDAFHPEWNYTIALRQDRRGGGAAPSYPHQKTWSQGVVALCSRLYCGTVLRQPTALIQAAKDSSPTFALATRS